MAPEIKFTAYGIPYIVEFANVTFRSSKRSNSSRSGSSSSSSSSRSSWKPKPNPKPKAVRANTYPISRPFLRAAPMDSRSVRSYSSSVSSTSSLSSSWISVSSRSSISSTVTTSSSWSSSTVVDDSSTAGHSSASLTEKQPQDGRGLYIQFSSPPSYPSSSNSSSVSIYTLSSTASSHTAVSYSATETTAREASLSRKRRLRRAIEHAVLETGMDSHDAERPSPASETDRTTDNALYKGTYGQVMDALKMAGLTTTPCPEAGFEDATRLGAIIVARNHGAGEVEMLKLTLWG